MTQQKISTPSVIDIRDSVILSANSYRPPTGVGQHLNIAAQDPWDMVLAKLEPFSLLPSNLAHTAPEIVPAMDNTPYPPSTTNPFMSRSQLDLRIFNHTVVKVVATDASFHADYYGTTDQPFTDAISSLSNGGVVVVRDGTYTFTNTVTIPSGVRIIGVHPQMVTIVAPVDAPAFNLPASSSGIESMSIDGSRVTIDAVVRLSGDSSDITTTNIFNIAWIGAALSGARNSIRYSRFDSSLTNAQGAYLQGLQQRILGSSFTNTLTGGAVTIEGSECGVVGCFFDSTLTGYSYHVVSDGSADNWFAANNFASPASLSLSSDYGARPVRYANTPNDTNVNNLLAPMNDYLGQPTTFAKTVDLGATGIDGFIANDFTSNPEELNLTTAVSGLDLFVQNIYEDRNIFFTSDDPTFDVATGQPLTGYFTWDGTTKTLTWPTFKIRSMLARDHVWIVNASSAVIDAGQALIITLDRSLSTADIVLKPVVNTPSTTLYNPSGPSTPTGSSDPYWTEYSQDNSGMPNTFLLPLVRELRDGVWYDIDGQQGMDLEINSSIPLFDPQDGQTFVICWSPTTGTLIWAESGRPLFGLTSFDIQGYPLPIASFVGVTNPRNPAQPFDGFSGVSAASLTDKFSSMSSHVQNLFELNNVTLNQSAGAKIVSGVVPNGIHGNELSLSDVTHMVAIKGSTYALSSSGIFRRNRDANSSTGAWYNIPFGPSNATALAQVGIGLGALLSDGTVNVYDPYLHTWTVYTPTISPAVSLPFPTTRSGSFVATGQSDYSTQSDSYSLFRTLDNQTIIFRLVENTLEKTPTVLAGETFNPNAYLTNHYKDLGYNVSLDPDTLSSYSLSNGYSEVMGLPSGDIEGRISICQEVLDSTFPATRWDLMTVENFAYEPTSSQFLSVYKDTSGTFYVFGGSLRSEALLYAKLTLSTFTPHFWVLDPMAQRVMVLGAGLSNEFVAYTNIIRSPKKWSWTLTTIDPIANCVGSVGVVDTPSGDIYALMSGALNLYKPTLYRYSVANLNWMVVDSFSAAPIGSFNLTSSPLRAYGASSDSRIVFLSANTSDSGRPILWEYDKLSQTTAFIPMNEGMFPAATPTACSQVLGAAYNPTHCTFHWLTAYGNELIHFIYSQTYRTVWYVSDVVVSGVSWFGLSLSRSANMVGIQTPSPAFLNTTHSANVYFATQAAGIITSTVRASILGVSTVTSVADMRPTSAFSSCPCNSFYPNAAPANAASRMDLSIRVGSASAYDYSRKPTGASLFGGKRVNRVTLPVAPMFVDAGTVVKNPVEGFWMGLNRGGWPWIWTGMAPTTHEIELYDISAPRGDVLVPYLYGNITDYDVAYDGADTIAMAYWNKDPTHLNSLAVMLISRSTGAVTLYVSGVSFTALSIESNPKISFNATLNSWIIAVTATSNRMVIVTRHNSTGLWDIDSYSGTTTTAAPSKPIIMPDGSQLIAIQNAAFGVQIVRRIKTDVMPVSIWTPLYLSSNGGFKLPEMIAGNGYWVFGSNDGTNPARILFSTDGISNWTIISSLSSYGTLAGNVTRTAVMTQTDGSVVVAGRSTAGEMGVWKFSSTGQWASGFSAVRRIGAAGGEEESGYTNYSWAWDGKLIYQATRAGRAPHISRRSSSNNWQAVGESLLGSGRFTTIGCNHYREQWVNESSQDLISRLNKDNGIQTNWSALPVATYASSDYVAMPWQSVAYAGDVLVGFNGTSYSIDPTHSLVGTLSPATSRQWPIIIGSTAMSGLGAGSSFWGEMVGVFPPVGSTNSSYFGLASLGASNLIKIVVQSRLLWNGTFTWAAANNSGRNVTISNYGFTFSDAELTANTGSIYFLFPNTAVNVGDKPLTWTELNYPESTTLVNVIDILDSQFVMRHRPNNMSFGQSVKRGTNALTSATMEPREINMLCSSWEWPLRRNRGVKRVFNVETTGQAVKITEENTLKGIQSLASGQLLLVTGTPSGDGFLYYIPDSTIAFSTKPALGMVEIFGTCGSALSWDEDF